MRHSLRHRDIGLFVLLTLFISCGGDHRKQKGKSDLQIQEELIEYNKKSAVFEEKVIQNYIDTHDLSMNKTGTGLWYEVIEKGIGDSLLDGQMLKISYEVFMLNDSLCYSATEDHPYTFRLGMADVETGIHEGMRLLRKGGRAKFIIPSHLAYGLMGDMNKIPPKTPVVYNVKLLDVR